MNPATKRAPRYLGCISSTRKPYPGEDHTRGNDPHDGPLTRETWNSILADIVAYELEKIVSKPAGIGIVDSPKDNLCHPH